MTKKDALITAAVSSLFGIGALVLSTQASAQAEPQPDADKCYGVVMAGKNDCAGAGVTPAKARLRRTAVLRSGSSCQPAPANVSSTAA